MGGEGDSAVGGGRKAARQSDAGGNRGRPRGWRGEGEDNEEKKSQTKKEMSACVFLERCGFDDHKLIQTAQHMCHCL